MVTQTDGARVSDRVFRHLCQAALSGRYEPGDKLPTQRQLAAELGVGMAPVREAVQRLEQLRIVEVRHGDGMRVADWRRDGGLDVIAHLLFGEGRPERELMGVLMEARRLVLVEVARLAAIRRSPEQAAALARIAAEMAEAPDARTAQLLDLAFFAEMVQASGNLVFVLVMNSVRQVYLDWEEMFQPLVAEHRELAGHYRRAAVAVKAGRAANAAAAVGRLAEIQESRLLASLS